MRVFYLRFCIVLDVLRVFLCIVHLQWRVFSHVFLHSRFPLYCVTMRVFYTFFCTRVSLSFKTPYAFSSVGRHNACVLLAFLHRFRRLTRFPPYGVTICVFFTFFCTRNSLSPYAFASVMHHNAWDWLTFLHRFRRFTRFPLYCVTMRVFFTFLCTSVSLSFKTPYVFSSVWLHNACVSHVYLYCLGRFQRFPLYCVTMRVFYTFFCTRVTLSFKTPYAFSSVRRHNACVLLAFLHRFRRLTRYPLYCVTMRMFFMFLCTSVSLSFKTPYVFSSVWLHNACVSHVYLYCLGRFQRFPLYCVTMRVFYTFFCTRVTLSFKTPYAFSSVRRHNACVLLAFLHRFRRLTRHPLYCVTMRMFFMFLCTSVSLSFKTPYAFSSVWRHNAWVFTFFCTRISLSPYAFSSVMPHNPCAWLTFLHRFRRFTRFPLYCVTMRVFFTFLCTRVSLSPYAFASVMHHNAWDWLTFLHRFRRFTRFPLYCVTMRVFFTFFCTRISLSPYAFASVMHHNAWDWLTFLHRFRRFTRFPLYCVTMRVFFTFLCTSVSLSFKTPYVFSSVWLHNACVSHVYLYCLGRFQRFPLYCVTMRVFYTFFCTRVSLSFKTPYAFSSVRRHNACVLLAFLHRFRRLTRHPLYCVTMRMFFMFLCTSVSLSFKTPYAFSSVWRHNACVFHVFLHSHFFIALRVFLRNASQSVCLTHVSASF